MENCIAYEFAYVVHNIKRVSNDSTTSCGFLQTHIQAMSKQCTGIALASSAQTRVAKPRKSPIRFAAPSNP